MDIELVEADRPADDELPPPRTEGERIAFWWQKVPGTPSMYDLARRIDAAIRDEREACARRAESLPFADWEMNDGRSDNIAAAIRGRK